MTITLNLPQPLGEMVEAQSREAQMPVEEFLLHIIERALARPVGGNEAPTGEEREHAARQLEAVMHSMSAQLHPDVSEQELERAMREALKAISSGRSSSR
jgi:hypothetical protein